MTENDISFIVRGAIFKVYKTLGPGLLEKVYEKAMIYELKQAGLNVRSQVAFPVIYKGVDLDCNMIVDLLVEDKVIVELKSVQELQPLFYKQVLSYLKVANKRLGILVNFNADDINSSIHRIVNGL